MTGRESNTRYPGESTMVDLVDLDPAPDAIESGLGLLLVHYCLV